MENLIVAVLVMLFSFPAPHSCFHENPQLDCLLSELNPFHTFTPCCVKRNFNIIPSVPGFPKWPFPVRFSEQILVWISYVVCISYMACASHAWLIILVSVVCLPPPKRPDRLWDPSSVLLRGHQAAFSGVRQPTSPHLVPRLRMGGAILYFPMCLCGVGRYSLTNYEVIL